MEQRDTYWSACCDGGIELAPYHACKSLADAFELAAVRSCPAAGPLQSMQGWAELNMPAGAGPNRALQGSVQARLSPSC